MCVWVIGMYLWIFTVCIYIERDHIKRLKGGIVRKRVSYNTQHCRHKIIPTSAFVSGARGSVGLACMTTLAGLVVMATRRVRRVHCVFCPDLSISQTDT